MKIYLVGGAVRDYLLNYPHKEKDWVVVGSTPEEMLSLGYKPVGKDFPVFLHPETHEEYALARTERKTAKGYKGFTFHTDKDVTLEEDLKRRDLTINAMAMAEEKKIIDPYGGQADLKQKVLKHVSPAFVEDPVRILRVARLMARYAYLQFYIAKETMLLMKAMVKDGEVDALVSERVWQEFDKALSETSPLLFFETLLQCDALAILFPELVNHVGNLESPTGKENDVRFAQLVLPLSSDEINSLCQRYRVPVDYRDLAMLSNQHQTLFKKNLHSPDVVFELFRVTDAWRREERLMKLLSVFNITDVVILQAFQASKSVDIKPFIEKGLQGEALGVAVRKERFERIKAYFGL